jgi:hypothetical protein
MGNNRNARTIARHVKTVPYEVLERMADESYKQQLADDAWDEDQIPRGEYTATLQLEDLAHHLTPLGVSSPEQQLEVYLASDGNALSHLVAIANGYINNDSEVVVLSEMPELQANGAYSPVKAFTAYLEASMGQLESKAAETLREIFSLQPAEYCSISLEDAGIEDIAYVVSGNGEEESDIELIIQRHDGREVFVNSDSAYGSKSFQESLVDKAQEERTDVSSLKELEERLTSIRNYH